MTDMTLGRWSHVPATILTGSFSILEIKLFSFARCLETCYTLISFSDMASGQAENRLIDPFDNFCIGCAYVTFSFCLKVT